MADKGVVWNTGRVFNDEHQLFEFNHLPEEGHRNPAFINPQQPYFAKCVADGIKETQKTSRTDHPAGP